ncbi:hypothetical protein OG799_31875 [Micromonospora sp. NBC_00898]|uniref:hypothetical protein n=1 Tax=Micromonospora sp. NBC_00898 TaxID=2975981 RepID=UPI00386F9609|nr:hypothetical protein OG799_31875 [Micromonospora sp. NBC_00898]
MVARRGTALGRLGVPARLVGGPGAVVGRFAGGRLRGRRSAQPRDSDGAGSGAPRSTTGAWKPGGTSNPAGAVPTGGTCTAGGAEDGTVPSAQRGPWPAAGSSEACRAGPVSASAAGCSTGGAGRWAGTTSRSASKSRRGSSTGGALTGAWRVTGGSSSARRTPLTWGRPLTRAGGSGADSPASGAGRSPWRVDEAAQPAVGSSCRRTGAASRPASPARDQPAAGGAHPLTERARSSC